MEQVPHRDHVPAAASVDDVAALSSQEEVVGRHTAYQGIAPGPSQECRGPRTPFEVVVARAALDEERECHARVDEDGIVAGTRVNGDGPRGPWPAQGNTITIVVYVDDQPPQSPETLFPGANEILGGRSGDPMISKGIGLKRARAPRVNLGSET
jgi:hypothetical protein